MKKTITAIRPSIDNLYEARKELANAITINHERFLEESRKLNRELQNIERAYRNEIYRALEENSGKTGREIAKTLTNDETMQRRIDRTIAAYSDRDRAITNAQKEIIRHYAELDENGDIIRTFEKKEYRVVYSYKS